MVLNLYERYVDDDNSLFLKSFDGKDFLHRFMKNSHLIIIDQKVILHRKDFIK